MIAEALSRLRVAEHPIASEDRAVIELVFDVTQEVDEIAARARQIVASVTV